MKLSVLDEVLQCEEPEKKKEIICLRFAEEIKSLKSKELVPCLLDFGVNKKEKAFVFRFSIPIEQKD